MPRPRSRLADWLIALPLPRPVRRFGRAQHGAAAAEFAAVAVPLLGIVCVTLETAVDYWAQSTLEEALSEASRSIYTGKFQTANPKSGKSESDLITALRTNLCTDEGKARATMFACSNVKLNVSTASSFSGLTGTSPVTYNATTKQNGWNSAFGKYACASANSIVLVQAAVDFPVFFNVLGYNYTSLPGGRRLLQAAAMFRVEPYGNSGACS